MILVVLNYTFLYLDRLFFSFSFFQKQTSLNSCGTISLYEICLNLSFWVTENRINGLWYLQCLRWRDSLFGNILSFTHPSVAKLTRYQTTWQPLAGVARFTRNKLEHWSYPGSLYILLLAARRKTKPYLKFLINLHHIC